MCKDEEKNVGWSGDHYENMTFGTARLFTYQHNCLQKGY